MITPVLISKYLAQECTAEEKRQVDEWKELNAENKASFLRLKALWDETGNTRPHSEIKETEEAWQKIKAKINTQAKQIPVKKPSKWKTLSFIIPRAAAAIIIITSMVIFYMVNDGATFSATKMIEIKTQKGERRQLQLPDGTKVWLNAESNIKYPEKFDGDARDIYLDGEAYFDVITNAAMPFKVYTGDLETKVLGTEFNVSAYADDESITVALDEGKVALIYDTQMQQLEPGSKIQFNKRTHLFDKTDIKDKHNLWHNDVLDFNNISLAEAVKLTERWFGKKIILENPTLQNCNITASFNKPSIEDVIEIIVSTLSLEYEQKNGEYIIKGNSC